MAPPSKAAAKKVANKGAPTSASKPAKQNGSEPERWTRKQIDAIAAQKASVSWVVDAHNWHQAQLEQLLELLEAGSIDQIPQEVREAVEFYVSQIPDGVEQDAFYNDQEIYGELLTKKEVKQDEAPYVRPPDSPEALEVLERVAAWDDTSLFGISKFEQLLKLHPDSPALQEAGLLRVCDFLRKAAGVARDAATQGLASPRAVSMVLTAMERCPRDKGVRSRGCVALMLLSQVPGDLFKVLQLGAADVIANDLTLFITDEQTTLTFLKVLKDLVWRCPEHSPEIHLLAKQSTIEILKRARVQFPGNLPIDKLATVIVPVLNAC